MTENQIREFLGLLEQEEQELKNQLGQVKSMKERQLFNLSRLVSYQNSNHSISIPSPITDSVIHQPATFNNVASKELNNSSSETLGSDHDFPSSESIDDQIVYLLNKIGRIVRRPDLQDAYKKATGSEHTKSYFLSVCRRMRDNNTLVAAKFNNAWTSVFYGLPEWVETEENGKKTFKENYRPSRKDLPTGYNTIEFDFQNKEG